jgi:hypothetical protein
LNFVDHLDEYVPTKFAENSTKLSKLSPYDDFWHNNLSKKKIFTVRFFISSFVQHSWVFHEKKKKKRVLSV